MTLQDVVARIFPNGFVRDGDPDSGCVLEVHGLSKHTFPQNCEVLASGEFQFAAEQAMRESFLVKTDDDYRLVFRMCPAPPDSGYAEFAQTIGPFPSSPD